MIVESPIEGESLKDYIHRLYPEVICHTCPNELSPEEKADMSYNFGEIYGTHVPKVHPLCKACLGNILIPDDDEYLFS